MATSHSYTTVFEVDGNGDATYETISQVKSISFSGVEVTASKSTHLSSTAAAHTYTPGLVEPGKITATLVFDKTQQNTLYTYIRTEKPWRITFTDGSTWACNGFWTKLGNEVPEDDVITMDIEVQLTAKPAFTAAS